MNALGFERCGALRSGRRIRRARFERRSLLPVSAASLVANSMRETLAAMLGVPVTLRLLEPSIPDPGAWAAITEGAQAFAVRASLCEASLVLRPRDALSLAAAAFGEPDVGERPLSVIENRAVERIAGSLAASLSAVCGTAASAPERRASLDGFVTYFELLLERPVQARIGVALSKEPATPPVPGIRLEHLLDVEVELSAVLASGSLRASQLLDLGPGAEVPMKTKMGEPGLLRLGDTVVGKGECGALGGRSAMVLSWVR